MKMKKKTLTINGFIYVVRESKEFGRLKLLAQTGVPCPPLSTPFLVGIFHYAIIEHCVYSEDKNGRTYRVVAAQVEPII